MKISKLDSTHFGAVYTSHKDFSKEQLNTANSITNELLKINYDDKKTAVQKWEDVGYDIYISPEKNNFVELYVMHKKANGMPNFNNKMLIGNYNNEYIFNQKDIDDAFKENSIMTKIMMGVGVAFVAACALLGLKNCSNTYSTQINKEIPTIIKSAAKNTCAKVAQFK